MASLLCGSYHVSSNHSSHMFFVTFCAGIWLLSCVGPFTLFQPTVVFVTFHAGTRLLSCVGPFIYLQTTAVFVTFRAGIWLLSCVGPFTLFNQQMFECVVTFRAGTRLL